MNRNLLEIFGQTANERVEAAIAAVSYTHLTLPTT